MQYDYVDDWYNQGQRYTSFIFQEDSQTVSLVPYNAFTSKMEI